MNDYSELKRLAEAATQGPWSYDGSYVCPARVEEGTTYVETWRAVADCAQPENTKFIAAANPSAVLALLDQIEVQQARIIELAQAANAARDEADRLREEVKVHIATNANLGQMVKARIREEDVIRKDAARYRWLRDRASSSDWEFAGYQASKDAHIDSEIAKETPSV